jgi:hypothetical protein
MPQKSKWTRAELASSADLAQMMGTSQAAVLKDYMPEMRRKQAAEHGVSVDEWVEGNLAAERFLDAIAAGHKRGDSPEIIAAAVGKPVEDIRKIIAGMFEGEGPDR